VETIEFNLTERDLAGFFRHDFMSAPAAPWSWVIVMAVMVVSAALSLAGARTLSSYWGVFLLGVVVGLDVTWLIAPSKGMQWSSMGASHRAALTGPVSVTLSPAGVLYQHAGKSWGAGWASVRLVERDRNAIYVYVGASAAVWMPRRAFASRTDFERAFQVAHASWAQAAREAAKPRT
jgi:hypothetical protein